MFWCPTSFTSGLAPGCADDADIDARKLQPSACRGVLSAAGTIVELGADTRPSQALNSGRSHHDAPDGATMLSRYAQCVASAPVGDRPVGPRGNDARVLCRTARYAADAPRGPDRRGSRANPTCQLASFIPGGSQASFGGAHGLAHAAVALGETESQLMIDESKCAIHYICPPDWCHAFG